MTRKKTSIIYIFIIPIIAVVLAFIAYNVVLKSYFKPKQKAEIVKSFPFTQEAALKEWEEKIFRGKVVYKVEQNQPLSYVRATSNGTASALYYKLKLDAKGKNPVISWKWNVDKFPEKKNKESLETENEDDFAARVYVIFPALFFTNSKVLEYVWAETLSEETIGTSPYSKNIKLIVAQTGPNKDKKWLQEDRDIIADYSKAFGTKPELDIGAVAFMTNTEHTGTSADAMYDEINLGYKE
ncbi:MAG: DUF3047 domain-containing protein [Candidatus Omnitrophota bacterium]|nr:DUF3047 domain-containing protein [Candidatus Omnitrophota bacterium]